MRDETPSLVWSPLLELPSDDVKLGYLDLNHWIFFAQASRFLTRAPRSSAVPAITPIPIVTVMAVVGRIAIKKAKRRTVKIRG